MRGFARCLIAVPLLSACKVESSHTSPESISAPDLSSVAAATVVSSSWLVKITDYARYWPGTDGIGINDAGDITTQITTPLGNRAALVPAGTKEFIDIGTLGGSDSRPYAITATQGICGGATGRAFLWHRATGMRDLGTLGGRSSIAFACNASAGVVGAAQVTAGDYHAFLWTESAGMLDLGTLGGPFGWAQGVNARGVVVGHSALADRSVHAFRWTRATGMIDLIPEARYSFARDVNDEGVIVGDMAGGRAHPFIAFRWTPTRGLQRLGTLGGFNSRAWAVNNAGVIVGESDTRAGQRHAFFWTSSGGMKDLGALPPNANSSVAFDINRRNEIAGYSLSPDPAVIRTTVKWTLAPSR